MITFSEHSLYSPKQKFYIQVLVPVLEAEFKYLLDVFQQRATARDTRADVIKRHILKFTSLVNLGINSGVCLEYVTQIARTLSDWVVRSERGVSSLETNDFLNRLFSFGLNQSLLQQQQPFFNLLKVGGST